MTWEPAVFALPDGEWTPGLEVAMNGCEDPMWIFDVAASRITWANPKGVEFWNANSVAELAARDLSVGMSKSTELRLAAYQRMLTRGEEVADRWTLFPGNRPQTVLLLFGRVPGEQGVERLLLRARRCETSHADIRGVEALRHTNVMITLCTRAGQVLMQNPAAAQAFGDLAAPGFPNVLRLRFASGVDADVVEQALSEEGVFQGEMRVRTRAGEVWHLVHVLRTSDPATGQPAILIDETNIDARKRSELALAAARKDLESRVAARTRDVARQQAFVEAILDTSPNFMFVADATGSLVRANRALRSWLAHDPLRAGTMAWELLGDCTPETFRSWVKQGPPVDLEVEQTSGTGERTVIYWSLKVFTEHGDSFVVGSGLDITERREMQIRAQTNDRMAALGTLASGVAHEINNPLAFVLTNVELAQTRAKGGETAAVLHHLESAAEACERAAKIVADLKGFSQPPGPTGAVNLRAVIDSARRMMSHLLVDRRMFSCSVTEEVWVHGDETKLCQVVLNLLVNAAEACEGRGAEASIDVTHERDGDAVVLVVDDTGCGMGDSVRARIFDPFYTTKGRRQGTGLGLAISHRIVQQLGGGIDVESRPDVGSTFRVRLMATSAPAVAEERRPSAVSPKRARARVLIVDDEPGLAEAFSLSMPEHDTAIATSGVEALASLDQHDVDVIVCDMSMPEMDGPGLHAILRREDPDLAGRMVFVTGGAFTSEAHEFLRHMSGRVLYKPVSASGLRALVGKVFAAQGPRLRG